MKTTKRLIYLLFVSLIGLNAMALPSKEKGGYRDVKNFDAVKVSSGIDLYIKMGNSETLKIEADNDIIDDVKTEVKDGRLHIYMKRRNSWFNWGFNSTVKVFVTAKTLREIDASAGSDVVSENTLEGDELKVSVSSGSDVKLNVRYKSMSLDCSSGSDARIGGKAKFFTAEASSGADIKARELEAAIGKLRASSGSDIQATVTDELYAKASSGADIRYYGNPQIKDTDTSSGGDVSKR